MKCPRHGLLGSGFPGAKRRAAFGRSPNCFFPLLSRFFPARSIQSGAALLGLSLCLLAGATSGAAALKDASLLPGIHAPPASTIEPLAGEPLIRFPMFACFDDDGRLFVAESSGYDLYAGLKSLSRDCRVSRLEDTDGDGRFDRVVVFQEHVTFPMGLAWHE